MRTGLKILLIFFMACQKNNTQDYYCQIHNAEWNTDSIVEFYLDDVDTNAYYDIHLKIRHTTNYKYQNLFLFSELNGKKDTLEFILSEKNGKWIGEGFGDIREVSALVFGKIKFNKNQGNVFTLEQAMRSRELEKIIDLYNVSAIGLRLYKNE